MCCPITSTCFNTDMHSRCKACMKPSVRVRDMSEYDKKLKMTIKACFSILTAIEVRENDKICRKCLRTLVKCSEFVDTCESSEAIRSHDNHNSNSTASETEIEEQIEGEIEKVKTVKFEDPPEVAYESDFEEQTSEDEGIQEELVDSTGKVILKYYCTVCRRKFRSRLELVTHVKGMNLYSWVLSD